MKYRLAALLALALLAPAAAHAHDEGLHASPDLFTPAYEEGVVTALDLLTGPTTAGAGDAVPVAHKFQVVGHEPLFLRGMNAAPAIYDHYVYVGNRTDGSPQHPRPGVLVVDIADPANPAVVGEIGPPNEGNVGETSRELRVWPQKRLLMVMNFQCSALIHACTSPEVVGVVPPSIRFYDLTNPVAPTLVGSYRPSRTPHEMFLWVDPLRPGRALLYMTTPTTSTTQPNLIVTDISRAREGVFPEVAKWVADASFRGPFPDEADVRLHSIGVSADGQRTYLAFLGAGFLILDSSDLAAAVAAPQLRLLTTPGVNPHWGNPGAHSAVKVPGRALALITDEVYGDLLDPITGDNHGCPWGWVRMIHIANEVQPTILGEYRDATNFPSYCETADGSDPTNTTFTSYSSHNPTLVGKLALVTWHSAGLHAFEVEPPTAPRTTGRFVPQPLPVVVTEDPALSQGRNKVVMWSYPIIRNGLIYVVDVRNGLYILRYTGRGAKNVAKVKFLEGNSNLGNGMVDSG
jgi:hypothetical protein